MPLKHFKQFESAGQFLSTTRLSTEITSVCLSKKVDGHTEHFHGETNDQRASVQPQDTVNTKRSLNYSVLSCCCRGCSVLLLGVKVEQIISAEHTVN